MLKNKFFALVMAAVCIFMTMSCTGIDEVDDKPREIDGLKLTESVKLEYAKQFTIDRYEGGYSLIKTPEGSFLTVPENGDVPEGLDEDIRIIKKPLRSIYLAATVAMSFFDSLDKIDTIRFSGTRAEGWSIDSAKAALENGSVLFAGKYSEPDYELLMSEGCPLSIQSTMIYHTPEVKEKLEELGITVFTDHSSYEPHPLGRCEWIKVYGEMTDTADAAKAAFDSQAELLNSIDTAATGKTAVFFYINNAGQPVVRKSDDYVSKMIEIAGGENVFGSVSGEISSTSVTLEKEQFYVSARGADYLIYNGTLGGEINTIDDLTAKDSILSDFKAVKEGNVWCTNDNLYQATMSMGNVIADFNSVFAGRTEENPPRFLRKIEGGGAVE